MQEEEKRAHGRSSPRATSPLELHLPLFWLNDVTMHQRFMKSSGKACPVYCHSQGMHIPHSLPLQMYACSNESAECQDVTTPPEHNVQDTVHAVMFISFTL